MGVDGLKSLNYLPVRNTVGEILARNVDSVEFLTFLDFALDFVLFSKASKLLC